KENTGQVTGHALRNILQFQFVGTKWLCNIGDSAVFVDIPLVFIVVVAKTEEIGIVLKRDIIRSFKRGMSTLHRYFKNIIILVIHRYLPWYGRNISHTGKIGLHQAFCLTI